MYHQESREVTTFSTASGLWQYLVLPFGLTNSSAVFNRKVRQATEVIQGVETLVDDVLFHSANLEVAIKYVSCAWCCNAYEA